MTSKMYTHPAYNARGAVFYQTLFELETIILQYMFSSVADETDK